MIDFNFGDVFPVKN